MKKTTIAQDTPKRITFGLTGGIGSGKSFVAHLLEQHDIPIYDTDREAKRLMQDNETIIHQLVEHFGPEVYRHHTLNKSFLAQQVFSNAEALTTLNGIVHPVVIEDIKHWFDTISKPLAGVESALLFSTPIPSFVTYSIGVMASVETRLKRAMTRDQAQASQIKARMASQLSDDALKAKCDYLFPNDIHDDVEQEIQKLIEFLSTPLF